MSQIDPDQIVRDFGRRVAEIRAERGWTQEQLAQRVGVSTKYLQRVEGGRENLTIRSLVEWANALKVRFPKLCEPPRSREVRRGRPPRAQKA